MSCSLGDCHALLPRFHWLRDLLSGRSPRHGQQGVATAQGGGKRCSQAEQELVPGKLRLSPNPRWHQLQEREGRQRSEGVAGGPGAGLAVGTRYLGGLQKRQAGYGTSGHGRGQGGRKDFSQDCLLPTFSAPHSVLPEAEPLLAYSKETEGITHLWAGDRAGTRDSPGTREP